MISMETKLRQARKEDIATLLQIYDRFIMKFVGSAARTHRTFYRMLTRKDNFTCVATDKKDQIMGYIHGRVSKRSNRGEFEEIVVDTGHDFEDVATFLVEKMNDILMQKRVSSIFAGSLRDPAFDRIFPKLGFSTFESLSVFMYSVLNVQKFLNELSPVFVSRLQRFKRWSGTVQLECEGHSIFLEKAKDSVQPVVLTNQQVDFKASLPVGLLTKLIFGTVKVGEARRAGQLKIECLDDKETADKMLVTLFPKRQFLIMDSW
jgi:N-acetylglutamate synthase-like GNAT family acetyltransferase